MEATVIDFILSTLMGLSAQYPDAAWLVTALSVVMTVCGLCAVATVWMPVPKEPTGLYAVFYRWTHALAAHIHQFHNMYVHLKVIADYHLYHTLLLKSLYQNYHTYILSLPYRL